MDSTTRNRRRTADTKSNFHEVDPNGDVIFDLDDGVSIRVSSVILRLASVYFEAMFSRNWQQAPTKRSAIEPARLQLREVSSHAIHRLFCLLHHKRDPDSDRELFELTDTDLRIKVAPAARRLLDLAREIDYLQCTESLSKISDTLLHHFAVPIVRDVIPFQATVDLVAAAYFLDRPCYFRLFTKRLVTDHTEEFENAELPEGFPDAIMSELHRQDSQTWLRMNDMVQKLAQSKCSAMTGTFPDNWEDALFIQKLGACILPPDTKWPAHRAMRIPLRRLLVGMYEVERIQRVTWCVNHQAHTYDTVGADDFKPLCRTIDTTKATGVCLTCARASKNGHYRCRCPSRSKSIASEMRWVYGDSFLVSTGAVERDKSLISHADVEALQQAFSRIQSADNR